MIALSSGLGVLMISVASRGRKSQGGRKEEKSVKLPWRMEADRNSAAKSILQNAYYKDKESESMRGSSAFEFVNSNWVHLFCKTLPSASSILGMSRCFSAMSKARFRFPRGSS